ncbi:MAG: poly(A) polymerase [Planctomycetota bacterium]|jgi:poly(A) polymerase
MKKINLSNKIFTVISQAGEELNYPVYVVGGHVRDQLLGRKKDHKDIDFVCVGSGIKFAKATAKIISPRLKVTVFKNYGTAMFKYDKTDYEFVGARKESYQRDSRNPIVEEGTLQDDQNRRDFTINALAVSLNKDSFGTLVDSFNGLKDLENKIIRTPLDPDITFSDDPLRMLRAIRFATQLDFIIEEKTLEAIARNKDRIKIISQERISTELNKIILASKPSIGLLLLDQVGLLEIIFPELVTLKGVEKRNGLGHKDNFFHTLEVLDNISENTDNLWLRWAAILHDIAKPKTKRFEVDNGWTFHGHEVVGARMVKPIFKRMKFPLGEEMRFVAKLVRLHLRPIPLSRHGISDSAIRRLLFDAGDDIDNLMVLCEADITSKNKEKVKKYLKNFKLVRQKVVEIEAKDNIRNFQPPISGEFIMETLKLKPCREIGTIKNKIKDAILEGTIQNDFEEAKKYMYFLAKEMNITH